MWLAIVGKRTFQGTQAFTRSSAENPSPRKTSAWSSPKRNAAASSARFPSASIQPWSLDLPAPIGIEGRLPELGEEGAVAEILEGADLREHLGLLPPDELRLEAGLAREVPCPLQLAPLPSGPRDLAVFLHEPLEPVLVDRVPTLPRELLGQLDREAVRRRERECILGRDVSLGRDFVEELHPARKRLRETLFLRTERFADRLPVRLELRVPLAHLLDDDVGKSPQVFEPDLPRLLDSAADDAPEDVTPALVRGHDAVADEAGHPAPVVGEDAVRLRGHLVRVPGNAALLLDPGHDRLVAVGLVDRPGGHPLHDRGQSLEAHARVDVLLRERRQRPVGLELVLHEDEVPELEEAVAARARGRAAGIATAVLLAPVEVDLRVGPARPRPADRPEVLAAREGDDPLARDADLEPVPDRDLVLAEAELRIAGVHSRPDALPLELQVVLDELGRELDRALLEVLAEREVPEHLEEREVVAVEPDLLDVGRAEALLRRGRERRGRLLAAEEVRHLRLHPRGGEQRRGVLRPRDERPGGQPSVVLGLEEGEEALPKLRGGAHALDSTRG